jgi:hypothetical protein
MISTNSILEAVDKRLGFWREQQQQAFQSDDRVRAAMCARIIDEYAQLTAEAAGRVRRTVTSETFIRSLSDCALV